MAADVVAQWIERRPPEPDGLSVVLVLRGPNGNSLGLTLYGSRVRPCTPAILRPRYHEDLDVCSARTNLPLPAEVRLDG